MLHRPAVPSRGSDEAALGEGAFRLVLAITAIGGLLVLLSLARATLAPGAAGPSATAGPTASPVGTAVPPVDPAAFLYDVPAPAPPLAMVDPDGQPFTLASMRGSIVFVFFGYTHCPDVCPATIGILRESLRDYGPGARALFVTIDPERDTAAALKQYLTYMPEGFAAVTGTAGQVRAAADAWGVTYARVETSSTGGYSMAHTADVFLVDATGQLRARFPFGTESGAMTAVLRLVSTTPVATEGPTPPASAEPTIAPSETAPPPSVVPPPASPPPSVVPSAAPSPETSTATGTFRPVVVSSSVWSGGSSPVILALYLDVDRLADTTIRATAQLASADGSPVGRPVDVIAVRPPGVSEVSYVATLDIPAPGTWQLVVTTDTAGTTLRGSTSLVARDPGSTPALGGPAPTARTPTIDDAGGDIRIVSTDPIPDRRLSTLSTTDALAARTPFVLVVDSYRFKVTPVCGRALVMAKYLVDRWPGLTFIHLEPYVYTIVTDTPVLTGSLTDPTLTPPAAAWGIGEAPWGTGSMPWIFIVDGSGVVRAAYQGVMGTTDVDVILTLIAQGD